jgi:hypothetical protein
MTDEEREEISRRAAKRLEGTGFDYEGRRARVLLCLDAVGFFDLLEAAEEVEACDGVTVGGLDRLRDAIRRAKDGGK